MKTDNPIVDKSKAFAIRIIRMCQHIETEKREIVLSRQVLRSGTKASEQMSERRHALTVKRILSRRCRLL